MESQLIYNQTNFIGAGLIPTPIFLKAIMEKRSELIVKLHSQKVNNAMMLVLVFSSLSLCMSYWLPHSSLASLFPFICSFMAKFYMVAAVFFFTFLFIGILLINKKDPVFIFSDEGVWIQYFGLIEWKEIAEMGEYPCIMGKEEPKAFGIMFKDPKEIAKRASWQGRSRLWGARVCKQAHIVMPNLDVPTYEILRFTHKYMNQ